MKIKLMIQVDTLCHKIPNFIEKAARAGVNRVFVGLESINAANLIAAKKRQNKITEYRKMLLAWKNAGAITTAGYILGFPFDTPESIREDIEIIKKELPLDILEFFILHAAAGLRGPQGPLHKGRVDGPGHEPVRRRARCLEPSEDDARRSGRRSIRTPGGPISRPSTWRRCCGAAPPRSAACLGS